MLSCFARAFPAREVETSGELGVVKTESNLINLGNETLHY